MTVSEERKRELISQDLRNDPYLTGHTPTTLYLRQNISSQLFWGIQQRTSDDVLYKEDVTDETIDWVIQTFLKNIPWHECFYKENRERRG